MRAGRNAPESIAVRLLISDMSVPMALPAPASTGGDDAAVRKRQERITRRAADGIIDQVEELGDLGLVKSATVEVRVHSIAPTFKLYTLNGREVFFGFYSIVKRDVTVGGSPIEIFDPMGKDVTLFHYVADEDEGSQGTQFVESARQWFDSVWGSVAREYRV